MNEVDDPQRKYAEQCRLYLINAYNVLNSGEASKAGEFLWGAMAEAIKAVAANKGIVLSSHGELWRFATELTNELGDDQVYRAFREANSLHSNFYESRLEVADVRSSAEIIGAAIGRLLGL